MRLSGAAPVLFVVLGFPVFGSAQVYQLPTPPPAVTAANASWQLQAEPVFFAGEYYYPSGPSVFFDGNVMVRSGVFKGAPLYVDATLEPYSIVYVPIGGKVMRPYERPRTGERAGTVGSRTPSFPIERDVEVSVATGTTGLITPAVTGDEPVVVPESGERAVGSGGTLGRRAPAATPRDAKWQPTIVQSIPGPSSNAGVWIEFNGQKWYAAGNAMPFEADRFAASGVYRGFPVYRANSDASNRIYVAAVEGGPLTPYERR